MKPAQRRGRRAASTHEVVIEGGEQIEAILDAVPAKVEKAIAESVERVTEAEAIRLRRAADTPQAKLVAPSIKVKSDGGMPGIVAGGSARIPSKTKAKYGHIFFGAEFGGKKRPTTQQFRPHKGTEGYWLYPQLRKDLPDILETVLGAVEQVLEDSGLGGDR